MKINPAYVAAALAVACVIDAAPIPAVNPADIVIQRSTDESNHLDEVTRRWVPNFDWAPDVRAIKDFTFNIWQRPTYMRAGNIFMPVKQKWLLPWYLGGGRTKHVVVTPHNYPEPMHRDKFTGRQISGNRPSASPRSPAVKELTNDTE